MSPEEEIQLLERQLEQKKREFNERGESVPEEKEVFREVLKEYIGTLKPSVQAPAYSFPRKAPPQTDDVKKKDDARKKEEREEIVRELIDVALSKNISEAVKIAHAKNPYFLDELHDHLVDDYYDKLVQLKKITEL